MPFVLSAISGMMGRLFQIQLKSGYREIPSLWTAVVGPSGSGKTPVMNAVFEPIRRLQSQADQIYKEQLAEYEKEIEQYDEWKKSRKQKTEIVPPQEKPVAPIPEQVLIDDATIQAVAEILEQNPYGAILPQDELSGFINGFDIYQRGSGGKDLAFWCSIFNGVPIRHNRKTGRKVFSAPTPAVAICGGIQPGILKKAICENPHFLDIGFNARILFVMPEDKPVTWSESVVSESAKTGYVRIIENLLAMRRAGCVPADTPLVITLSQAAKQTAWVPFYNANIKELVDIKIDGGRTTWAKLPAYAARLALVLHVVQWLESMPNPAEQPTAIPPEISRETMWNAIRLLEWFKGEAARMLNLFGGEKSTCDREAMAILQAINENGGSITVRELARTRSRYNKKGGAELAEKKMREMASQGLLESENWKGENGRAVVTFRLPSVIDIDTISPKHGKDNGSVNVNDSQNIKNTNSIFCSEAVPLSRKPQKKKTGQQSSVMTPSTRKEPHHEQSTLFD